MTPENIKHFERTRELANDRALDYMTNDMPVHELVQWIQDLIPANDWAKFLDNWAEDEAEDRSDVTELMTIVNSWARGSSNV